MNLEELLKKEKKNKTISLRLTESDYLKLKKFCSENNLILSDLINLKIDELLIEIDKYEIDNNIN